MWGVRQNFPREITLKGAAQHEDAVSGSPSSAHLQPQSCLPVDLTAGQVWSVVESKGPLSPAELRAWHEPCRGRRSRVATPNFWSYFKLVIFKK